MITPVSRKPELVERTLMHGGWFAPKIALIDVDGVIVNERTSVLLGEGEHPVSLLLEKLDRARHDSKVRAVILRINSPGGAVVASELMHLEIERFRTETHKPVVAVAMDVAASGGYYIACACDEIVAHPSSVTGSIGVLMQLFDVTGTMSKIGVVGHTIKSGDRKGAGSPFERLSPEDRAIFQAMIDEMYERFVQVVIAGRPNLTEHQVRELADGRVYTASQALEAGLIDHIATIHDVVALLKQRTDSERASLVTYGRPTGDNATIYARAEDHGGGDVNIVNVDLPGWLRGNGAQFMYLWQP
jgi:protease-4